MAVEGRFLDTTIEAGEDLNSGCQYHAIALDDGKLAANGAEACGILMNKPKTGEGAAFGFAGEMKFAAGGAISRGGKITVTTSGWFVAAGSGYHVVGRAVKSVTSGSIGTGIFGFAVTPYAFSSSFIA